MAKRKYNFRKKDEKTRKIIEKTIRKGVKNQKSGVEVLNELRKEGLGYNENEFYQDKRKIQAEYIPKKVKLASGEVKQRFVLPKDATSRQRKEIWFNEVFEPFRKSRGLTSKQASRIIKQETRTGHKLIKDMRLGGEYWEKYKDVFP